jgi:hypothetical protein
MLQIKLAAEIVWMDETKKIGGARFTELTADVRSRILQWLNQTSEPEPAVEEFLVPSGTLMEETNAHFRPRSGTLEQPTQALDNASQTDLDLAPRAAPRFGNISETSLHPARFSVDSQIPSSRPRLLSGLAAGFLIFAIVFMPFLFSQNLRHEFANSLIRVGEKLEGNRTVQPDASSPVDAPISGQNSVPISSAHNTIPGDPAKYSSDRSGSPVATQTIQGAANSADSHLVRRQDSGQHNTARDRNARARQLWSSLAAGDDSAEVPLAQLYLKGDGVPRNCEQAQVLLRAASKKGNVEAMRQLQQLGKRACR